MFRAIKLMAGLLIATLFGLISFVLVMLNLLVMIPIYSILNYLYKQPNKWLVKTYLSTEMPDFIYFCIWYTIRIPNIISKVFLFASNTINYVLSLLGKLLETINRNI